MEDALELRLGKESLDLPEGVRKIGDCFALILAVALELKARGHGDLCPHRREAVDQVGRAILGAA